MAQAVLDAAPAELIRAELAEVEEVLRASSASDVEVLQEAARHILCAGGKRLRPQMTLLSVLALGGSAARAVPLAAACELVHTATLVHDDIVDASDSRRGRRAVQFYFGNSASVLMGDFLVVRAFGLVAGEPDRGLWRMLVETIARMCEGEVLQICVKGDTSIGIDVYETIVECKTAILLATCTRFGAALGGATPDQELALSEFGFNLGMAFQIQDDILDFVGDEATLGKPIGGDLREGKVTLPVIYALCDGSAQARTELLRIYEQGGPLPAPEVRRAAQLIEDAGGFSRAREHAMGYIHRARSGLERLPWSEAREALSVLAGHVVDRRK